MAVSSCLYALILIVAFQSTMIQADIVLTPPQCRPVPASSLELIQFFLNLIIYQAEFSLRASTGRGIDDIAPSLVQGHVPVGATVVVLDNDTRRFIEELGLISIEYIRAISESAQLKTPIPRVELNLSAEVFTVFANAAFNVSNLTHPYSVSGSTANFLVAAAFASSVLQQYLTEVIPSIVGNDRLQRSAAAAAGTAASALAGRRVIKAQLIAMANSALLPYTFTVGKFFNLCTELNNRLGGSGVKDEGLIVPLQLGAENRTTNNLVPADANSLAYPRNEREILRIVFGTGNPTRPGVIFTAGFNGTLSRRIILQRLV